MKINQIVMDTREQREKHNHILKGMKELGVEVIRDKLYVGDYSLPTNRRIAVDTKRDIVELSGNICSGDHSRFREEMINAKRTGTQLYVLIEENEGEEEIHQQCGWDLYLKKIVLPEDLKYWKSPVYKRDQYKTKYLYMGLDAFKPITPGEYRKLMPQDKVGWEAKRIKVAAKGDPLTKVNGEALGKAMRTMEAKYGVIFKFCSKNETAKTILQLLGGEND